MLKIISIVVALIASVSVAFIAILRNNGEVTTDQLAQLDSMEAQLDAAFDASDAAAQAEDDAADAANKPAG